MLTQSIKDIMHSSVLCWLATVSEDGQPNVSPKEVWTSFGDDCILIANIASPQSIRNISCHPLVCVSFLNVFLQKGYQIKGSAEVVGQNSDAFELYAKPLKEIAGKKFPFAQLFKIKIQRVKEILAPSYVMYPQETDEASQIRAAHNRYGVRPL